MIFQINQRCISILPYQGLSLLLMLVLEASGVMSVTFHEQLEAGHGNVKDDATVPEPIFETKTRDYHGRVDGLQIH